MIESNPINKWGVIMFNQFKNPESSGKSSNSSHSNSEAQRPEESLRESLALNEICEILRKEIGIRDQLETDIRQKYTEMGESNSQEVWRKVHSGLLPKIERSDAYITLLQNSIKVLLEVKTATIEARYLDIQEQDISGSRRAAFAANRK